MEEYITFSFTDGHTFELWLLELSLGAVLLVELPYVCVPELQIVRITPGHVWTKFIVHYIVER